jgi:hypothetical protein
MFLVEAQKTKSEIMINQERMEANIEATRLEFQTRLKEVRGQGEHGRGTETGTEKSSNFDGTISWAVFECQFETVAENYWKCLEKSTYLITALQGRATDVLHGVPKGATYEKSLEDQEDSFWPQCVTGS